MCVKEQEVLVCERECEVCVRERPGGEREVRERCESERDTSDGDNYSCEGWGNRGMSHNLLLENSILSIEFAFHGESIF